MNEELRYVLGVIVGMLRSKGMTLEEIENGVRLAYESASPERVKRFTKALEDTGLLSTK